MFLMAESNVLDSGLLEHIDSQRDGLELCRWFAQQIAKNLLVVFTRKRTCFTCRDLSSSRCILD